MDQIDPALFFFVEDDVQRLARDCEAALVDQRGAACSAHVGAVYIGDDDDVGTGFNRQVDAQGANDFAVYVEAVADPVRPEEPGNAGRSSQCLADGDLVPVSAPEHHAAAAIDVRSRDQQALVEVAEIVGRQLLRDETLEAVDREKTAGQIAPAPSLLLIRQAEEIAGLQGWTLEAPLPEGTKPVDHLRWRVALGVEGAGDRSG